MNALGAYNRSGQAHFDRVLRSFDVFKRNAEELMQHVRRVEANAALSMQLAQASLTHGPAGDDFSREFWSVLDQRLHNLVASAASLIEHTRPLVRFYEPDEEEFATEWHIRNQAVALSPGAKFLRNLRNYLLHYDVAPTMHTMKLQAGTASEWDNLTIQLSAAGLLEWSKWSAKEREFIGSFDGGPPLAQVALDYANDMMALYKWLYEQQQVLHPRGRPQERFYTPWPPSSG